MYEILFGIFLGLSSIGSFYILRREYLSEKSKLQKKYGLENFECINASITKAEIGTISYRKINRFIPYITYSYCFKGGKYENDTYSFPVEYEYPSDVDVKRIINKLKWESKIYVRKDNPKDSYVKRYEHEIEQKFRDNFEYYCSMGIFSTMLLFGSISVLMHCLKLNYDLD